MLLILESYATPSLLRFHRDGSDRCGFATAGLLSVSVSDGKWIHVPEPG